MEEEEGEKGRGRRRGRGGDEEEGRTGEGVALMSSGNPLFERQQGPGFLSLSCPFKKHICNTVWGFSLNQRAQWQEILPALIVSSPT